MARKTGPLSCPNCGPQVAPQPSGAYQTPPVPEGARINLRTSPEAKALIERAAALLGTSVSAFMLQYAHEAARQVVADNDTLILSQQAFEAFVAACEQPSEPN